MADIAAITAALARHHLIPLGGFNPDPGEKGLPGSCQTLLLIGLAEPGFWPHFTAQREWQEGLADPMDRWSRRVIGRIACDFGGKALFPFGGPPFHPFYQWALRSGRVFESPVRLLVHDRQGLMVSFRGALALRERLDLPAAVASPCESCARPCLGACPAGAMGQGFYDVPACHAFLEGAKEASCLNAGCLVRRACPLSQAYARLPEQSAYHMSRFHT